MGIGNIVQTGLKAAMTNMENLSNNIANANTIGFKKSTISFADIYSGGQISSNQVGLGVKVDSLKQNFSSGRIELTDRGLDLSLGNDGFFVQKDNSSGLISYTRAGRFDVDKDGNLLGAGGKVQGYQAVNGQVSTSGNLTDLKISDQPIPAKATSEISLILNLNADAEIKDPLNFDKSDPSTFSYRSDSTIFDSLGRPHAVTAYYIKSADNAWDAKIEMDDAALDEGSITFNDDGSLASVVDLDALSFNPGSGAKNPQAFSIGYSQSTQYAGENTLYENHQNGYESGTPTGFEIDNSGRINVYYSNGQTQVEGQVAVARFKAPQGLAKTTDMSWLATQESGDPILSAANSDGAINVGTLELSNVDLTEELIKLMGAQHDFQANAQVQETYNKILQTIENL